MDQDQLTEDDRCIRGLEESELKSLASLYQSGFGRAISIDELRWRYFRNPERKGVDYNFVVINAEGHCVAHTAFIPGEYELGTQRFRGLYSSGSVVLAEVGGIFPSLYAKAEYTIQKEQYDFSFCFANENSNLLFQRLFGYQEHFFEYRQFDPKECVGVQSSADDYQVGSCLQNTLDENYLRWRIGTSAYYPYREWDESGLRFIYKPYKRDEIDVLAILSENGTLLTRKFLKFLTMHKGKRKINMFSTNPAFSAWLSKCGCRKIRTRNRFLIKKYSSNLQIENIFFQMLDSDIF